MNYAESLSLAEPVRPWGVNYCNETRRLVLESADPSKTYRCTLTVATMGDHECRVNSLTHEVYDRRGASLHYIGRSYGNTEADIEAWAKSLAASV